MNNMKKKVIISSIMTIVICLTLIAGSTFALFTSESTVNVAVTAGTVNVKAYVDESTIDYTSDLDGGRLDQSNAVFNAEENTIDIMYMVPGDTVTFNIVVENYSNVAVDYTVLIEKLEDPDAGNEGFVDLWDALDVEFKVDDNVLFSDESTSSYQASYQDEDPATNEPKLHTVTVTISFPNGDLDGSHDNYFQGASCKLAYKIVAVQGNAN